MIEIFKWSTWIILVVVQIWGILKQKELVENKRRVKLFLNFILALVIALFLYQPKWNRGGSSDKILVYSAKSNPDKVQKLKDSLQINESISYNKFKTNFKKYSDAAVYFVGEDIEPDILRFWSGKPFFWCPEKDDFHWYSILRQGEIQTIKGNVFSDNEGMLKVIFAGKTLDSLKLNKGNNFVNLSFPVFTKGRSEVTVQKDGKEIIRSRFFVKELEPYSILILNENPDFETRSLSEWLGNNGFKVQSLTRVTQKEMHNSEINLEKDFVPDLIITSSAYSSDVRVKKNVLEGGNVLFINFSNFEDELKTINKQLKTSFGFTRISKESDITISANLSAVPYKINLKENQRVIGKGPSVYEKRLSKVGISLLNETFPSKLAGDSVQYSKIWLDYLAALAPKDDRFVSIKAPIFSKNLTNIEADFLLNKKLVVNQDTLFLTKSIINPNQGFDTYVFNEEGWVSIADNIEVFVDEKSNQVNLKHFVENNTFSEVLKNQEKQNVSNWLWFIFIMISLILLWVEPKINY